MVPKKDDYETQKEIAEYIGRLYRNKIAENELVKDQEGKMRNRRQYIANREFIYTINSILNRLSKETKYIIIHEYMHDSPADWYLSDYSRSTFYCQKRKAVGEFVHCLFS